MISLKRFYKDEGKKHQQTQKERKERKKKNRFFIMFTNFEICFQNISKREATDVFYYS